MKSLRGSVTVKPQWRARISHSAASAKELPHAHREQWEPSPTRMLPPRDNLIRRVPYGGEPSLRSPDGLPLDSSRKYDTFRLLVDTRFRNLLQTMGKWSPDNPNWTTFGIKSQSESVKEARLFEDLLTRTFRAVDKEGAVGRTSNPLFWKLRNAFVRGNAAGLTKELKFSFLSFVLRSRMSQGFTEAAQRLADFRFPYEWFPATRAMQRVVHLHVGPTNSGKTYQALKALEGAKSGIYAGPLRLLAHEIYSRFQAKGKRCSLITGEEQRIPDGEGPTNYRSCTVEMTPLNERVDVAVIDEIQMISDEDRGWAWTQAFLGVQARELHLCGEERTVDLIESLCNRIGDKCIVHRYQRLSSLQTMQESLKGDFSNLRKGDAVVAFSRVGLHVLKSGIQEATGRRCAIVYGSLPPETRAQQAALFNDPDNDYDFLAASDAIGMGLNLEIKRVVFESVAKHDGLGFRNLTVPEVKQIGGRAGRYRTAAQDIKNSVPEAQQQMLPKQKWGTPGFVTTMEEGDLELVRKSFTVDAEPIQTAGIQAPVFALERFASYFPPRTPLTFIMITLRDLAKISGSFHWCRMDERLEIAELIEHLPMSMYDRCIFLSAPTNLRDVGQREVVQAFARCVASMRNGHLLDITEIDLDILDKKSTDHDIQPGHYLRRLEALHKSITLYLWLSYRYDGVFQSQHLAFHVKQLVEDKITDYLNHLVFSSESWERRAQKLRSLVWKKSKREEGLPQADGTSPTHEGVGRWNEEGHGEPLMDDAIDASELAVSMDGRAAEPVDAEAKKI